MDKENGKNNENNSGSSKSSNGQDPSSILDAASLFGAYWPRDASTASLFAAAAAASSFGIPQHPASAAQMGFGGGGTTATSRAGAAPSGAAFPSPAAVSSAAGYGAAAYTNTLSVAASQAASLGMPAASAAWWSMASHLAAQDYLARLQASGLNFQGLGGAAAVDPYLGLLAGAGRVAPHPKPRSRGGSRAKADGSKGGQSKAAQQQAAKYASGLTIQPAKSGAKEAVRAKQTTASVSASAAAAAAVSAALGGTDLNSVSVYASNKSSEKHRGGNGAKHSPPPTSIFTSPLSIGNSTSDKGGITTNAQNSVNNVTSLPSSILSDPSSILGGVRLPPDTEIIKYTSSIVGPRVPGTTNRGRKKTISLDPPSVTVHPAHSSLLQSVSNASERIAKRQKFAEELTPPSTPTATSSSDRVEVIKLPATNGSPSGSSPFGGMPDSSGEAPLNLSLKPSTATGLTSSLNSLSNMSANIGADRISRRKPGPKPRRVVQPSQSPPPSSPFFGAADSPQRPPSRSEGSDGGSSTSSTSALPPITPVTPPIHNHKEGRPRNLGRGVSKPKKNTVASLLAQSRALGIKPMPMLDPNVSMNQQMNMLRSNILAAQQYIQEAGGDEKALNKFLQDKFKNAQSDSSTVDASDSDNLTDSNHTDSEMEVEVTAKKQKQYDERLLRVPLEKGWKRETVIRGLTKNGGIKGDVTYSSPDSSNKFKQMSDVTQYLEYQKNIELSRDNFTFSCRVILGDYLQPMPPERQVDGTEFIHLSEEDVTKRLEELKAAMRTSLPVEQRIELARKQQAARAAARLDREQQRLTKELERSERQEAARREKELKTQQMLEAKRKKQEEMEKQKHEEQQRKQQERELKRQQTALLKEQIYIQEMNKQREMLYTVELERERRRQHMALVKAMESRRKLEERERKKQQLLAEKQANKEKKMEQRRIEMEILAEIRKPCEDLELEDQKPLPDFQRIPGLKLCGKAFGDVLMVFEFLHTFGETLGFDMESLPTLDSLQQAMMPNEHTFDAEEELFSVMTHLLVCAIEDPGIPNPARYTTILGQSLRQADITHANLSEILRIYLYANATGEVKALTGVHFERDREKRVADHHQSDHEMLQTQSGKNSQYYELLHENPTYKMSDMLKDKPFMSLNASDKAAILAFICNELLQNKAVIRQIESSLESVAHQKKEKWMLDNKIKKVKMLHSRKCRTEAIEKSHNRTDPDETGVDSPSLHKDDLLDYEENEMSENESVGTQPEEDEDNKATAEELGKKLEKLLKTSETQQQALNTASLQLRATCFGEDRYFRRFWSLSKSGGIFVEAMESAEPEELENQNLCDQNEIVKNGIKNLNELSAVIDSVEKINDSSIDKEVSSIVGDKISEHSDSPNDNMIDDNDNEHRKTPNRLEILENGELMEKHEMDSSERNLAELQKSVDDIVQSLEKNLEREKEENKIKEESQMNCVNNSIKSEDEPIGNKKFNLFEKLGQCMERENNSGEDLKAEVKAEVKEELKNEILNELKCEIKTELKVEMDDESKWFSILHKDNVSCDEVHLTAGNKWDNGNIGACTKEITELKIPVFPAPGSNSSANYHNNCESPAPLQMTNEENAQMEHIKMYGLPKSCVKKSVPLDKRYGWWRIFDSEQLKEVLSGLHVRGARERELKRGFINVMQQMYERQGKLVIEEGSKELTELIGEHLDEVTYTHGHAPVPDEPGAWSVSIAHRSEMFLLEQVEALEDKVASASMQIKGWKVPSRDGNEEIQHGQVLNIIRERLASLEVNIERRYLKPPLGVNIGDPNLAVIAQEASGSTMPAQPIPGPDEIPKGLAVWRDAIVRAHTSAQLAMCLYALEGSIAWDKSIMKANCQFCHSGDNEDKLLLCDSCDKGYHTYCFKPKMDNIPEGDWYCHECMNKATGERNCIVCGKKVSLTGTRLIICELCPRAYHTDCIQPQMHKVPRGKWYCVNCIAKKPQKKVKKAPKERHSESSDQPPPSPAPSHSSVTTNEDQPPVNCSQVSDVSNSSLVNIGSPSAIQQPQPCSSSPQTKKDRPNKKLIKELAPCKAILDDLECHDDAWPFLLPVNTKQFPTYKKIIKLPMDLSTIKKRLQDLQYKSRDEFCADVRQIFNNCEIFNEDDSPVGKAGHCMRQFFEARWNELCSSHS